MLHTLKVTGKLSVVDGASDNTSYGEGTARVMSLVEIGLDPQIEVVQTRSEDAAGTLTVGDTYVQFSSIRLTFKSKRMTREHFAAFLMGSIGSESSDYFPLTMMQAASKQRNGAAKIELYHPSLGPTVPLIRTASSAVLLYSALRPEGNITAGAESEGEFGFAMDIADGQVLEIHKSIAAQFPPAS